jgi:hypothetical protein
VVRVAAAMGLLAVRVVTVLQTQVVAAVMAQPTEQAAQAS